MKVLRPLIINTILFSFCLPITQSVVSPSTAHAGGVLVGDKGKHKKHKKPKKKKKHHHGNCPRGYICH